MLGFIIINSFLHITSEMSDETLNGPCCCISKSTNSVAFNLVRKFLKHIDFSKIGISKFHSFKHINHPSGSFSAWCALSTRLMSIELSESKNCIYNISLIIHDYNSCSSKTTSSIFQIVEIHKCFTTLLFCQHWHR